MEIEDIRKELNDLLENIIEHSSRYSDERPIPSLEISFVLTKINKMQESMSVLRYLLEEQEKASMQIKNVERQTLIVEDTPSKKEAPPIIIEETIKYKDKKVPLLSEGLEQFPIPKLIDALTLNDRYLYANELFDKDMNLFNELVKSIDNCSSINDAKALISKLGWNDENEHVLSFTNLVERRFL